MIGYEKEEGKGRRREERKEKGRKKRGDEASMRSCVGACHVTFPGARSSQNEHPGKGHVISDCRESPRSPEPHVRHGMFTPCGLVWRRGPPHLLPRQRCILLRFGLHCAPCECIWPLMLLALRGLSSYAVVLLGALSCCPAVLLSCCPAVLLSCCSAVLLSAVLLCALDRISCA